METTTESTISQRESADRDAETTTARGSKLRRTIAFGAGVLLGPAAIGAGVAALTGSRRSGWLAGGASALVLGGLRWQLQRWFSEEPAYTVERRIGDIEIRRYAPRVEAITELATTDFDRALEGGFRRLAGYIFGGNDQREKLAMTTPVTETVGQGARHVTGFVMPRGRARKTLPRPADKRVMLVEIPERRYAVVCYRGRYNAATVEKHAKRLRELAATAGIETSGEPMFAGFDPPWTVPWLRRNEIWIELA